MLSDCTLPRSTSISCSSQAGSPGVATSQRGSSRKVNGKASTSPFKPSWHTTRSFAVTVCISAAGGANYGHLWWACHLSWHWCGPHWIGVCGTGPHSAGWSIYPVSTSIHQKAWVCGLPLLELSSGPRMDVPILWQGQRPFHIQQQCLAWLAGMPCPIGASQHPPMPLPEKGCSVVPAWLLTHGNLSPLGKSYATSTSVSLSVPTSWHPWRGVLSLA